MGKRLKEIFGLILINITLVSGSLNAETVYADTQAKIEIEKTEILRLDPFLKMGKPQKIASYFGGKDGYLKAVKVGNKVRYRTSDIQRILGERDGK